jgi:hypothetical protein
VHGGVKPGQVASCACAPMDTSSSSHIGMAPGSRILRLRADGHCAYFARTNLAASSHPALARRWTLYSATPTASFALSPRACAPMDTVGNPTYSACSRWSLRACVPSWGGPQPTADDADQMSARADYGKGFMRRLRSHPKCPQCGSARVARIIYGLPTPELVCEAEARDDIALGGCCIAGDDPVWLCRDCENAWGMLNDWTCAADIE